jgi:hypothetical protein
MNSKELEKTNMTLRPDIPPAAQRWFEHVLPKNSVIPSRIKIKQEGTMDIRGRLTPFSAEGVYQGSPLSFNWKARLGMLPGVWVVAEDGHADGGGWGGARLWGVLPMGKRTDPEVLAVQLIRNIGELVYLPEFALSSSELTWSDAGEDAFEIRSHAGEREIEVRFELNDQGDIVRASSPSRPYDVPGGYEEAPWHYDFDDHRDFGGIRIPSKAVATYERKDGAWEYFRGQVISVIRTTDSP